MYDCVCGYFGSLARNKQVNELRRIIYDENFFLSDPLNFVNYTCGEGLKCMNFDENIKGSFKCDKNNSIRRDIRLL